MLTGFWLWDHEFAAKVEILFWLFTGLFALPTIVLIFALSEPIRYRASGAKKIVEDLEKERLTQLKQI